jgi:hypothetical protein
LKSDNFEWWASVSASRKMKRIVQSELLDTLSPDDPRAVRSRRDLHRINAWMGNHEIMTRILENNWNEFASRQITELGAGDAKFLLSVAQKIKVGQASSLSNSPGVKAILLDRQKIVSAETLAAFAPCGWRAEAVVADVFNWPAHPAIAPDFSLASPKGGEGWGEEAPMIPAQIPSPQPSPRSGVERELGMVPECILNWPQMEGEVVIANLFLHHFEDARLAELLHLISQRARLFIALEPRRAHWPLFCSRLLWVIGCNGVTRHDAVVSVRAGFSGRELSSLWPDKTNWQLTEQSAGAFSHLFIARKMD